MKKINEERLKAIGARIKALRKETGMGYVDFAIKHSLDPKNYWLLEAGQVNFTIRRLLEIFEIHNLTPEEFFKGIR